MLEANILEENYLVQSLEQTAITLSVLHRTAGLSNKSQRSCQLHVAESGLELVLFFFFFHLCFKINFIEYSWFTMLC